MAYATAQRTRFQDPDEVIPVSSDLLSRKPTDVEPQPATCRFCGSATLRAWADDPEGPVGSRLTDFDPEPVEDGRWFMNSDGSLTLDPEHGTHQLHDCTRPAAQPVAETLTEAVA
jgi:hypothetical protein